MKFAKYLFAMLVAQIRKELTIQKPTAEQMTAFERQETRQGRILKTGLNGFAMIGLITLGMAVLIL